MRKTVQRYRDDDVVVLFETGAFIKAMAKAAADVAGGRITPAEGRRIAAEGGRTLKAVAAAIRLGRTAKRLSEL